MKLFFGFIFCAALMATGAMADQYDTDFNGAWRGSLYKIDPQIHSNALPDISAKPDALEFSIEIRNGTPHIFILHEDRWNAIKPGRFGIATHKTNAIIASIESAISEDGFGWVETWNITLTEKDDGALYAYWVRSVNNPHLPDGSLPDARFFMSRFGTLERSDPVPDNNVVEASAQEVSSSCTQRDIVCSRPLMQPDETIKFNPKLNQD